MVLLTAMGSQCQPRQSGRGNLNGGQGKKGANIPLLLKISCSFLFKVSDSLDLIKFEEGNEE